MRDEITLERARKVRTLLDTQIAQHETECRAWWTSCPVHQRLLGAALRWAYRIEALEKQEAVHD